ncbi:hypothetical protein BH10ACT6_BH10ACT6_02090 [soil metagenome]
MQRPPEVDEARWVIALESRTLLVAGQLSALDAPMTRPDLPAGSPKAT